MKSKSDPTISLLHKNCFFETNVSLLLKHNKDNYAINLQLNTKLSFNSLYALFERELIVLRNYLFENQALKRICEFTSRTNISILFVFKRDNTFQLCINY